MGKKKEKKRIMENKKKEKKKNSHALKIKTRERKITKRSTYYPP
jgi:hypothetical protein